MAFSDLSAVLDWDKLISGGNCFVLVSETERTQAQFAVPFFLAREFSISKSATNHSGRVCLLSLAQNFQHYSHICNKVGVNLSALREKGQLLIVDIVQETANSFLLEANSSPDWNPFVNSSGMSLQGLFEKVKNDIVTAFGDKQPLSIIIDDLSSLVNIGCNVKQVAHFVSCLLTLLESRDDNNHLQIVVYRRSDGEDEEHEKLYRYLAHQCDIRLDVDGLTTGFSNDIHGQLKITFENPKLKLGAQMVPRPPAKYHFKVLENNIRLFQPGTATAIL